MRLAATKADDRDAPEHRDAPTGQRIHAGGRWKVETLVFSAFLLAAIYSTWPIGRHAATHVPFNLIDSLLNAWIFSWAAHSVTHIPWNIFDGNIFFPDRLTFAFTENDLGQSLPVAPLVWLTGNGILAVNIATIVMYAVASYGTYLLARELGASRSASFVAGLTFGLAPYRLSQIQHVHVVAVHLMPFLLLLLVRLRTRPMRRHVAMIGLTLALQFWSSLSGGAITICAVLVWVVWELAGHRRAALPVLVPAAKGFALAVLLVVPLAIPYLQAKRAHAEYQHPEREVLALSATPASYTYPIDGGPVLRPLHRWLVSRSETGPAPWEKHLFPGVTLTVAVVVATTAAALRCARRSSGIRISAPIVLALAIAVTGFVLSLGPRLGGDPTGIPLPFEVLARLTPGRLLRVPARFGTLVPLGLGLAVALALSRVPLPSRRPLAALLVAGLAIELMPQQIPTVRAPEVTSAHEAVAALPGAVLGLPTVEILSEGAGGAIGLQEREPVHLYFSTAHFRPLVNGYSAFQTRTWWEFVHSVQDFPSPASIEALQRRGVGTVVVETDLARGTRWEDAGQRLARWPGARLVAAAASTEVWDISSAARVAPQ